MITIEINDAEILGGLDRLARAVADMSPLMAEIADLWGENTQSRMRSGATPDGTPFAPRSQATLNVYARNGKTPGPVPLWLSGEMREYLHTASGSDYAEIASGAIQAAVMQFGAAKGAFGSTSRGAPIPWGTIPARPFLGVSDSDRIAILSAIEDWLTQAWDSP